MGWLLVSNPPEPLFSETLELSPATFKILTLGESTTYGIGSNQSWPSLLEDRLNEAGLKTKVTNVARPATTTFFLLERLNEQLDLYKPDLVISMMGINDNNSFWLKELQPSGLISWIKSLRILKVSAWTMDSVSQARSYVSEASAARLYSSDLDIAETPELIKGIQKSGYSSHKQQIVKALDTFSPDQKSQYYAYLAFAVMPAWRESPEKFKPSLELFRQSINHSMYGAHVLEIMVLLFIEGNLFDECRKLATRIVSEGVVPTDVLLTRFAGCAESENDSAFWRRFFSNYGFRTTNPGELEQTKVNYNVLVKTLREKGVNLIAMQYPTVAVSKLTQFFDDKNKPDCIVSNRSNFQQALKKYKSSDLFTDFFAGSFGHTTDLGNLIIVENLLPKILGKCWVSKGEDTVPQ